MQQTLGAVNPEAAYFGPEGGVRTAFVVFDMQDPSQLPRLTEPLDCEGIEIGLARLHAGLPR